MQYRIGLVCLVSFWSLSGLEIAAAELPLKTVEKITEKVVPAYRAGNHAAVWNVLNSIVQKLSDDDLAELDLALEDEDLPKAAAIFAEIHLAPDAASKKLARPKRREAAMILRQANESIDETMEQRDFVSILDPDHEPESSFKDFDRAVWDAHVYRNELENAAKRAIAAGNFQRRHLASLKKLKDYDAVDFGQKLKDVYQTRLELHERDLKLKLDRIAFSIDKLAELKPDKDDTVENAHTRLWAGHSLKKDGETLLEVLELAEKKNAKPFEFLTELNSPKARSEARKMIKSGRKASKDLLEKSEDLFVGLHWWFRGRYGRGTHNMGLLKPKAAARNVQAQKALRMPKRPPRPTDPAMFVRREMVTKKPANRLANKPALKPTLKKQKTDSDASKLAAKPALATKSDSPSINYKKNSNDYVYGVAYDKKYARSPDYDRRHHYIWSQEPPVFVTQQVGLYFH